MIGNNPYPALAALEIFNLISIMKTHIVGLP